MPKFKKILLFALPLVVYAFPAVFLYAKNVKEAGIGDMLLPMLALVGIGYAMFGIALCVYRHVLPAALFSALFGLVILNYGFFERIGYKLMPFLRVWQMVPLIALCIGALVGLMYNKARAIAEFASVLLGVCFAGLIVVNMVGAAPTELSKLSLHSSETVSLEQGAIQTDSKANIYYILMDEYASFDQCRNSLGYDNAQMETFLTKNNFNISYSSANDNASTNIVMANVFAMDYLANNETTNAQLSEYKLNGALHSILEQCGYTKRGIGDTEWLGIPGSLATEQTKGPAADDGESFWSLLTKNMLFSNAATFVKHFAGDAEVVIILETMDSFDNFKINPNSNEFVMMYLCCPHHPFYFKKDGTMNMPKDYFNYEGNNIDSYIGQMQYVTTRVTAAVQRIIEEDENSIIVLFSDHGLRFGNAQQLQGHKNILNAVYYKGQRLDELEGKSSLNTMLLLLNKERGLALEYRPMP